MQLITEDAIEAADLWGGRIPGRDLRSALENAQPLILGPELVDLRERFDRADRTLRSDASDAVGDRRAHLQSKAEGVRLCMSYLDEISRSL